jgi:hypothetical protein
MPSMAAPSRKPTASFVFVSMRAVSRSDMAGGHSATGTFFGTFQLVFSAFLLAVTCLSKLEGIESGHVFVSHCSRSVIEDFCYFLIAKPASGPVR